MQSGLLKQRPLESAEARLSRLAWAAMIAEAELTPKPALVDGRGSGAHADLSLDAMRRSATAIRPFIERMALISRGQCLGERLRRELAIVGRQAERAMLAATHGANAHRGAIWSLGLLAAGASVKNVTNALKITRLASAIARVPDRAAPRLVTHGALAEVKFGVGGARAEACNGFPHVIQIGLPALRRSRALGVTEQFARLDTLLSIMSSLDDTCLLHRGGQPALIAAKNGARAVLNFGGTATREGFQRLLILDRELLLLNASPGGSADLLAATLFLDAVEQSDGDDRDGNPGI